MLQYVNSFACTANETKKNIVINLIQNEPIIPDDDEEEITSIPNEIASIIMDEDCARSLAESILHFFPNDVTVE